MCWVQASSSVGFQQTASLYSGVAGVLAGFAFSAILLSLTQNALKGSLGQLSHAIVAFVSAFVGLIVLAISYADLTVPAGRFISSRDAMFEVGYGAVFALCIIVLLYGTREIIPVDPEFDFSRRIMSGSIGFAGPLLAFGFIAQGVADVEATSVGSSPSCSSHGIYRDSAVIALGVLGLLYTNIKRPKIAWLKRQRNWIPVSVLLLSLIVGLAFALVQIVVTDSYRTPPYAGFIVTLLSTIYVLGFAFSATAAR